MPLPLCPRCRHAMNFDHNADGYICYRCAAADRDKEHAPGVAHRAAPVDLGPLGIPRE